MAKAQPVKYGVCPACGATVRVRADGLVGKHKVMCRGADCHWWREECPASRRQPPKAVSAHRAAKTAEPSLLPRPAKKRKGA